MTWQTFLFIPVALFAFGFSGYKLSILIRLLKGHQGKSYRLNDIPARIMTAIVNVFGQKATMKKKSIGIAHATIFWGFIIITVGTLEQFATTIYQGASFEFLGPIYAPLVLLQDLLTFGVLCAVLFAFYRRLVLRPEGLGRSKDAIIILTLTGSLMVSILLMNGFHIIGTHPWYKGSMPVSSFV